MKTTTKITKRVLKEIEKRNELFKTASKAEKRVLIAKDVIAQINSKRFIPKSGTWTSFTNLWTDNDNSLRETILSDSSIKCECCALGSIMASCTLFNNKYTNRDTIDRDWQDTGYEIEYGNRFKNGLTNIFSKSQLRLIEIAFESADGYFYNPKTSQERKASLMFKSTMSAKNRLISIMENIVKNKGTFKLL